MSVFAASFSAGLLIGVAYGFFKRRHQARVEASLRQDLKTARAAENIWAESSKREQILKQGVEVELQAATENVERLGIILREANNKAQSAKSKLSAADKAKLVSVQEYQLAFALAIESLRCAPEAHRMIQAECRNDMQTEFRERMKQEEYGE